MNKQMKKYLILLLALLLVGCKSFSKISLSTICRGNPELCADLYQVSDCRFSRTDVIRARYYYKIEPTGIHMRNLLAELDKYQSCLRMTLLFELTANIKRKKRRLHNYLTAKKLSKTLLASSKGTNDPFLAYYLWINYQDIKSKSVFIKAAADKNIKNVDLVNKLAVMYSQSAPEKGLKYFFKAMRLSDSIDELPSNLFINIMSLFYRKHDFKNAYIWALVNQYAYKKKDPKINLDLIIHVGLLNKEKKIQNEDALKKLAKQYYNQLRRGDFNQFYK